MKKNRKLKKKRQGTTELRLKTKVPEEEIVRQNIEKLKEYREKNTIKSNVVEGILKRY